MDQPIGARLCRCPRYVDGSLNVYSLEGGIAPLDIKAYRVYYCLGTFNRLGYRSLLPHIGLDSNDSPIIGKGVNDSIRVAHCHAHAGALGGETLDDVLAEEAGAAKNSNQSRSHKLLAPGVVTMNIRMFARRYR